MPLSKTVPVAHQVVGQEYDGVPWRVPAITPVHTRTWALRWSMRPHDAPRLNTEHTRYLGNSVCLRHALKSDCQSPVGASVDAKHAYLRRAAGCSAVAAEPDPVKAVARLAGRMPTVNVVGRQGEIAATPLCEVSTRSGR